VELKHVETRGTGQKKIMMGRGKGKFLEEHKLHVLHWGDER